MVNSCSANSIGETVTAVTIGSSSLSRFKVILGICVVPIASVPTWISPKVKIIVSITSTSSSFSTEDVEIEILAVSEFAGIIISVSLTVYSSSEAVLGLDSSYKLKGILISNGVVSDTVAVNKTSVEEPSTIDSSDITKVISGTSSLSSIVISNS